MASLLQRVEDAMNTHDPDAVAALFADTFASSQPVHPHRAFRGREQVARNWAAVFEGVPDFRAELLATSLDGGTEWGEWEWRGTHDDGSAFLMRGVIIARPSGGLVGEARLYLEPVDPDGGDIDASLPELYESDTDGGAGGAVEATGSAT